MENKLLLIGGGGHCHSILDSVLVTEQFDMIGIIDQNICSYMGINTIGTDDDIPTLVRDGWNNAFISVGSVGNTIIRRKLYEMIKNLGVIVPSIVDPTAIISRDAVISEGTFIGKGVVINAGANIGRCSIINTRAVIEHDCMVGDFSHISTNSTLCGRVIVGEDTHIGAGSVVRQCVQIGSFTMIGAGSVVVSDLGSNVKAYGNPCKVVK